MTRGFSALFCVTSGLLALVSCQAAVGDQVVTPSPPASTVQASVRAPAMCDLVPAAEVSLILGVDSTVVGTSSNDQVCTYRATKADESFDVAFRTEEVFESLEVIDATFDDTVEVTVGDGARWSPSVSTLWMVEDGVLYASQVVGEVGDHRALELAIALSRAVAEWI